MLRRMKYGRPTEKVFCVGFQKTGTTSLQYALSLLGYRTAGVLDVNHIETPEEMYVEAQRLVDQFDAFADNPWPIYFQEFDKMVPGSKFILTTRDPERWYSSVCKHFGDSDSKLRRWVYGVGTPVGNKSAYVSRLLAHQDDVRRYFEDRPEDLMEFDVSRGDGWPKLCSFLGKRVPDRFFPKLNTAAMRE